MDAKPRSDSAWRCLAIALIAAAALVRLAYLAFDCPLDLAPDEAHYWDWSRHLDWSYYSKGPLVAWLIRASCELFGGWSRQLAGSDMLAVRLPAVLCGSLLLASLYLLTMQVFGRPRLACGVVAAALTLPLVSAGASLMTIDAPFTCCWGWALVLGHRAIHRGSWWAWPLAGLMVGLGLLAKYTMVLWLGSFGLFLAASPVMRRWLVRPGVWVLVSVAAACCLPIVLWNQRHDWVSLWHVQALAGMQAKAARLDWHGPLVYLAGQAGLLLIFWFVAWLAAIVAHRPGVERDESIRFLWWFSLPTFVLFLLFSVKTNGGEPNWPAPAYLSGLVLAANWLSRQLASACGWYRRWTAGSLTLASTAGLLLTVLVHHSEWAFPVCQRLVGPPTPADPTPLRRLDPTCRLRGWRTLAREVDRCAARLKLTGIDPVLAGTHWSWPGELGFYCTGQPTVYSLGPAVGDRHSQYDLWRPNPIDDPGRFQSRSFIVVGPISPALLEAFERVEPPKLITHSEHGQPIACWAITVCHGYRGFTRLPLSRRH